jgi:hypothetical protein
MLHLSPERLAALADEPATPAELGHLAGCADCTRERAAHRALDKLAAAGARSIGTPLTTWESLRPALVADGVIDSGRGFSTRARPRRFGWLQAAAAAVLVTGGAVAGRLSAGGGMSFSTAAAPSNTGRVALADSAPRFKTLDEARAAQTQSQVLYQNATAYLAQYDTTGHVIESPAAMRTRLAALDGTRQVLNQALSKAPYDPVINGYYLSTVGQREATLRMINTAAPASMRLMSY